MILRRRTESSQLSPKGMVGYCFEIIRGNCIGKTERGVWTGSLLWGPDGNEKSITS